MDAFAWVVSTLTLLLGLVLGAFGLWMLGLRDRFSVLNHENRRATQELATAESALATAHSHIDSLQSRQDAERQRDGDERKVLQVLAPVAEKLQQVQQQVTVLERDRVEQYGQLSQQLNMAAEQDAAILRTTSSLAGALRNTSARGTWGEVQLRRVVEAAGMLSRVDFNEQVTTSDGKRPDMVITLPGGKSVVVDSKVPLNSYLLAQEIDLLAEPSREAERRTLLEAHAKALRAHVDDLGSKAYWESLAASPELVVCFLPAESFLAAAVTSDPELLDHAFSKNVALAAPATLLSILKGLSFAWRQELLTENARALFDESKDLYNRLGTLGSHVTKLGSSLKSSVERYNSFVGTLESRVLPSVRRIQNLDPGHGLSSTDGAGLSVPSLESTPRVLSASELLQAERPTQEQPAEPRSGAGA
ncbi:DNA recombination protein RmuC [Arthrobacter sp. 179]|uniref:DNA recombination protein RmuC n=1 Tax=Arthrobacter sp. 179 TaxID=3457734 RepID=UPI00403438CC